MLSTVTSGAVLGIEAYSVEVEVHLGRGMMVFSTVGLPVGAVCEARTRVKSALDNCGFDFPQRRVTVNLAPGHIRKDGTAFDLPIALGILAADGALSAEALGDVLVVGELALDGRVRGVRGILAIAAHARRIGLRRLLVPRANAAEASVVEGLEIVGVESLPQAVAIMRGTEPAPALPPSLVEGSGTCDVDLADVRGQGLARRALEVAAAGGHNLLFVGPPGSGKTMLARRLPTIVPPMTFDERLESSIIASVAGVLPLDEPLLSRRPFRAPHHSVSEVAITGGGPHARPGEVSLAHNGVLFLDELPEFKRSALEALRQPIEDGHIVVARALMRLSYPARATLVAAMNPCPCGYFGHPRVACSCHPTAVRQYRGRVSGPLLDRIDLQVSVDPVTTAELRSTRPGEASAAVRERVVAARGRQRVRFGPTGPRCNAQMKPRELRRYCKLTPAGESLLTSAVDRLQLSARSHDRLLKVARTLADLEGTADVTPSHLAEAVQYRQLDRDGLS